MFRQAPLRGELGPAENELGQLFVLAQFGDVVEVATTQRQIAYQRQQELLFAKTAGDLLRP